MSGVTLARWSRSSLSVGDSFRSVVRLSDAVEIRCGRADRHGIAANGGRLNWTAVGRHPSTHPRSRFLTIRSAHDAGALRADLPDFWPIEEHTSASSEAA
ncbi:hypothetical protein MPLA_290069 [Mesorhizobium sp. ORS 3359]|nr:hypothetical protein MPLA_290069 [Mesorhizobium sp. ORS 3359]